jgi:hypothetical protein
MGLDMVWAGGRIAELCDAALMATSRIVRIGKIGGQKSSYAGLRHFDAD